MIWTQLSYEDISSSQVQIMKHFTQMIPVLSKKHILELILAQSSAQPFLPPQVFPLFFSIGFIFGVLKHVLCYLTVNHTSESTKEKEEH